jgi:hypothetical protein
VPAKAVTRRPDAVALKEPIVAVGQLVVTRAVNDVEAAAIAAAMSRALEAAKEEALKKASVHNPTRLCAPDQSRNIRASRT